MVNRRWGWRSRGRGNRPCARLDGRESSDRRTSGYERPIVAPSTAAPLSSSALSSLAQGYASALSTESAANQTYLASGNGANADITKQNQRLQQDATTYQANEFGLGCNAADFSTYESCVHGEEQAATSAENDEAAADAQLQRDVQQYSSASSTFETSLSNFISQIVDLPWPGSMTTDVGNLLGMARKFRSDLALQAAVTPSTPTGTVSAIQAQGGIDVGNFNDALSVIKADLLQLGATVPH
jgi:hypothetical protein